MQTRMPWIPRTGLILAAVVGWSAAGHAQEDADSAADDSIPGNTLVPLPAVFYQTETGFGFGLVATYYFRLGSDKQITDQPSTLQFIGVYTTKNQIIGQLRTQLYTDHGRNWIIGQLDYSKFPTKYWGVGNDTPESGEEDYTPRLVQVLTELQRRVLPAVYVGLTARIGYREILEKVPGGLIDGGEAPGAENGRIVGAGLVGSYDTRSSVIYPRAGSFHQVRTSVFDEVIGSSYDFVLVSVDLRRYVRTLPTHVLALRALGTSTTGSPPFDLLPLVGGDQLMRGYFQGRFRDKHLVVLQAEYRLPVFWRIGVVGFGSVGQVAPTLGELGFDRFKGSAGGGFRFLLSPQEGLNIRADFAYGFDVKSTGFYLGIGEAF